jgi:5'-deoxynucleotidase YfbR-like HD superfamily hydrolase
VIGEQTVGAHSFGVLSLLLILHPNPTLTLIKAAAWHDMAEQEIGDVPSPVLRRVIDYGEVYAAIEEEFLFDHFAINLEGLSAEEKTWLWGVDKLDCLLFCRDQVRLGNLAFRETCNILYSWFYGEKNNCPDIISRIVRVIELGEIEQELDDLL